MASRLNKSVKIARKGLILFLLFALCTFILQFTLESINPTDPKDTGLTPPTSDLYELATSSFGPIPKPEITSLPIDPATSPSYGLSERTSFPEFKKVFRVYQINKPQDQLGNTTKARLVADKLGFDTGEQIIDDNLLYWENTGQIKTLFYNKLFDDWKFKINLNREILPIAERADYAISLDPTSYQTVGTRLLTELNFKLTDFTQPYSDIHFVNYDNQGNLIEKTSPKQTDLVRIGLFKRIISTGFKPDISINNNSVPEYSTVRKLTYSKAPVTFVVRGQGSKTDKDIVEFQYQEFKYGNSSGYPGVTPLEAWQFVQRGEGKIIWLLPEDKGFLDNYERVGVNAFTVEADKTEIIYLEPETWNDNDLWTHFLQPFYLFKGKALLTNGKVAEFAIIIEALNPASYITPQ